MSKHKKVLFTGTPCQCAALKQYLSSVCQNDDNLIVVDVVCHGTPSPLLWDEYVRDLEHRYKSKLVKYTFRNKEKGWRNYHIKAEFENGIIDRDSNSARVFVKLFSDDVILRPSCYYCRYCSLQRVSDLTIGDFWGIEDIDKAFSDNKGVSMLLINSDKGRLIWNSICENLEYKSYPLSLLKQPNLYYPTNYGKLYDAFWKIYTEQGYKTTAIKFGWGGSLFAKFYEIKQRVKNKLERV